MRYLLFVLLLLPLTACETLQEADRQLYSANQSFSSKDTVTGARTLNTTSRAEQITQGNQAIAAEIARYSQAGKKINAELDGAQYARLQRIFERVFAVSHYRTEQWKAYLVPDESFNAYTTGGSGIVVHLGLMKALNSDDEVAAVIGHEIAHVTANHVFEQQTYATASAITRSDSIKRGSYNTAFTYTAEVEADRISILYAALAGYDPYAASKVWQRMEAQYGSQSGFFSDHPINNERIVLTKETAAKVQQYYSAGQRNPNFEQILQNNTMWQNQPSFADQLQAGQGGGIAGALETYLNTRQTSASVKAEEKRQQNRVGFISQVAGQLKAEKAAVTNTSRFVLTLTYTGSVPLKSLELRTLYNGTEMISRVAGPIAPNQSFEAPFGTGSVNANSIDFNSLKIGVNYAEPSV